MAKTVRRAQAQKPRWSGEMVRNVQERRRSNAAGVHGCRTDYQRRPKHVGRGWEDF